MTAVSNAIKQGQLTLEATAQRINELNQEAESFAKSSVQRVREIGRLLTEAKASVKHGAFEAWINHQCNVSVRQARKYMELHQRWDELVEIEGPGRMSQISLSEGIRILADHRKKETAAKPKAEQAETCFKGGEHEWEHDGAIEGTFCRKCHEEQPGSGPATHKHAKEHFGDQGEPEAEGTAAEGVAPGRLLSLWKAACDHLAKAADQVATIQKEAGDSGELGNISDGMKVVYADLVAWRKENL